MPRGMVATLTEVRLLIPKLSKNGGGGSLHSLQ
jgi:hypothetical protein